MKKHYFLLLFLSTIYLSARAVEIQGVVYDDKKEPIIGASIQVKDTKLLTITDIDGKFRINVEDAGTGKLVVSFIGMKKVYVPLEGKTMLTIFMDTEANELDELVVVGYGKMKKSDITGSVVSIHATQEQAMNNNSFDKMMQGKAAGVNINTSNSAPGGGVNITIRGTGSLRSDNAPLYVVDGVVIDVDQTPNSMSQGTGGGNSLVAEQNPLASISPQDIENIEVLKDASATAIYGNRGANGVIIITTKKGTTGKPSIVITSTTTIANLAKEIPMLNTAEYVNFYNTMNPSLPAKNATDLTAVDWQKYSTRQAISQNQRASVSGKNGKTSYYLSTGYLNTQGIIYNTGVQQFDTRLNLTQELSKNINLTSSASYSKRNTSMTSGTDKLSSAKTSVVAQMISFHPYRGTSTGVYDEEATGPDAWFSDYDDNSIEEQFTANASLDITLLKWLKLQLKSSLVSKNKERSLWTGDLIALGAQTNGKAGISGYGSMFYNNEAMFQLEKKVGSHSFNGTVGVEYNQKEYSQSSLTGENFDSKLLRAKGIRNAQTQYPYIYTETAEQLASALGRMVYNYKDKYILTGTYRADASSKFKGKNKVGYFPSTAFAWRADQEEFLKGVDAISNLKVRLGWGQVGNQAIKPYQTGTVYESANYTNPDGSLAKGIIAGNISNPNLKWETSEQYNGGVDFGIFDQRVSLTVDVFQKRTKDLLQEIALPLSTGYLAMYKNRGEVENRGLELTLDTKVIDGNNFKFNLGGNISFVKNTIIDLGMSTSDFGMLKGQSGYFGDNLGNNNNQKFPANIFLVGHSIGQFFGYKTNGIIPQGKSIIYNGQTLTEGNINLVDLSGDGVINETDRTLLGSPNPDFTYAINANLSYKDFTLSMAFNGVYGSEIINANLIDQTDVSNSLKNISKSAYYNAWNATTNPTGTYPKLGANSLGILTDRIIEDGSYLRLSYVTLSYKLRAPKLDLFNSITLSVTANNIFCITNYSGYDPDVNSFGTDVTRMGVDMASYPAARSFAFGIVANF